MGKTVEVLDGLKRGILSGEIVTINQTLHIQITHINNQLKIPGTYPVPIIREAEVVLEESLKI